MTDTTSTIEYPSGKKPWWWFPALMPIWCSLAMMSVEQMHDRLACEDPIFQESEISFILTTTTNSSTIGSSSSDMETDPPRVADYVVAI
eukprot:CAMPEP_0202445248 /NCGR_PEP_ID=MMETSP1360-20130828/4104_1 /ASSEMBLY_ACC=CAM_ASM_000848 /TAXON_ID=515479 /ORGANISM="Licmophora paradoxa, Strain CCMP2313" /LENGTH=88 /DNA_ID=CAMNT_0049061433 /DNA_START=6 /DNA_END=269 /DNA_ORIENTATION=-